MDSEKRLLRSVIDERLVKSGEKDKLKEYLRLRLIESGWRDNLKMQCKEIIRSKDPSSITIDELISEMLPKARASVPDNIRVEMFTRIRKHLQESDG
ncbi:hypothetical protein HK105_208553 [Polyrhizophydium stewartii]|uniref:Transcription and mRNA export factor SUS1 n=1 Tax=Polyrhizophydium stewartii TaxID=2732419 RepID=A0ABR4MXI3_9FUNG|nr:hypothetical protein HK105_007144 [Polyrhizophydium stewartii]